ncbi:hypothetical protein [Paenibacillus humicus]|uniref:hypothetical protein n=1 Tax=Paenibacillus humicus TaxID=412861 RepID=UPI003F16F901
MRNFSSETAQKILSNEIGVETLLQQYPEYQEEVLRELQQLKHYRKSNLVETIIDKYTISTKTAIDRISKSQMNEKTINAFLPQIIKARFAIYLLEKLNVVASAGGSTESLRFNLWDGTILQSLLFSKGLKRKPVSLRLFRMGWRLVLRKQILMPLVNKKGIYCFYSKPLVKELSKLIGDQNCIEIGAGDGTLTLFLEDKGVDCKATDDHSWSHYIEYPKFVEKLDAKQALEKYHPSAVICSWPVPNNTYEKQVFKADSVNLYIVIGTSKSAYTGDFDAYAKADHFTMEKNEMLSAMIVPPSPDNAVYIFRRIK